MVSEGDIAPDFQRPTDDGTTLEISGMKGSPVVLYFYPKDDTSGCTKEALAFTEHAKDFSSLGARVVGVSPNSVAAHEKFKTKHGLKITLASDAEKQVCGAYGVWVEKSMYCRKYMGVERSTFLIDTKGRIARAWRKVKVPGHVEAVLDALKQIE